MGPQLENVDRRLHSEQWLNNTLEQVQLPADIVSTESDDPFADLEPRQRRFVEEYVIDLNATQAAIRAGYSQVTAQEQSSRLLSKVMIRRAVEKLQREISNRLGLTAEKVLTELSYIAFSNMADYMRVDSKGYPHFDFSKLTPEQAAAVSEVTVDEYNAGDSSSFDGRQVKCVKINLHDKLAALVDVGRHMGLFRN